MKPHNAVSAPIVAPSLKSVLRRGLLSAALFSSVINILALIGPVFMLEVYDRVIPSQSVPTLVALGLLALGVYALSGLLDIIRSRVMTIDQQLFLDRRASREGQKKQLRERVQQLNETIAGHDIQQKTKLEEIELIDSEYQAVKKLFDKGMMTLDRVNALARGIARLRRERGQLMASIAEARGKIAETELQRLQVDQTFRSEVSQELRDLLARQGELIEREITASDQLKRIDITSPELTGTVVRLSADLIQDERTGIGFYRAGIKIPQSELAKLQGLALVPGMPVESMIQTGSRNVMSYLLKPISDHAQQAFREG